MNLKDSKITPYLIREGFFDAFPVVTPEGRYLTVSICNSEHLPYKNPINVEISGTYKPTALHNSTITVHYTTRPKLITDPITNEVTLGKTRRKASHTYNIITILAAHDHAFRTKLIKLPKIPGTGIIRKSDKALHNLVKNYILDHTLYPPKQYIPLINLILEMDNPGSNDSPDDDIEFGEDIGGLFP